jgi:hypothetical protein
VDADGDVEADGEAVGDPVGESVGSAEDDSVAVGSGVSDAAGLFGWSRLMEQPDSAPLRTTVLAATTEMATRMRVDDMASE